MMFRRMMLWNPKTGKHTLRAPAQSKSMSTRHKKHQKSHFIQRFTGKMSQTTAAPETLCELAQSKHMSRFHKGHFTRKFTRKMPQPKPAPQTWCEPAQSKRMSKFHKSHFTQKFTSKMPQAKTALQTLCEPASNRMSRFHKSHVPLYPEIYRTSAAAQNRAADLRAQSNRMSTLIRNHFTVYGNLQEKCRGPKPRRKLCASLRSRNACQHSQEPLYAEIYR